MESSVTRRATTNDGYAVILRRSAAPPADPSARSPSRRRSAAPRRPLSGPRTGNPEAGKLLDGPGDDPNEPVAGMGRDQDDLRHPLTRRLLQQDTDGRSAPLEAPEVGSSSFRTQSRRLPVASTSRGKAELTLASIPSVSEDAQPLVEPLSSRILVPRPRARPEGDQLVDEL